MNLVAAFSFNGIGVAAVTAGLVHPVFVLIAMVLSVSVVLTTSAAGRLLPGEGITAAFGVHDEESDGSAGEMAAD